MIRMPLRVNKPTVPYHKRSNSSDRIKRLSSNQAYSILDSPLLSRRNSEQELNSPVKFHKSKSNSITLDQSPNDFFSNKCAFCDELLSLNLPGESTLLLSCSHQCHKQCLLISIDKNNLSTFPSCNICNKFTRCLDDDLHKELCRQKLLNDNNDRDDEEEEYDIFGSKKYRESITESIETFTPILGPPVATFANSSNENPITPTDQMIPDTLVNPPINNFSRKNSIVKQLLSPDASFSYNKQLYEEILKPQVDLITNIDQITPSDKDHEIHCLLNVKPPKIYSAPPVTNEENELKYMVVSEFKSFLDKLLSTEEIESLDELLLVDSFKVSIDGDSWNQAYCFLFGKCLLLVDKTFDNLLGKYFVNQDFSSFGRLKSTLILNLNDDNSELHISHSHVFIINKWNHYLSKLMRSDDFEIPLFQLTSNCWQLVKENRIFLASDILKFQEIIDRDSDIPSNLFIQAIPQPDPIPLNLIVSICLVNNVSPPISNVEYKERIVELLNNIRSLLKPTDRLGLIFIGVDTSAETFKLGSFTGCVEPSWNGWNSVIELIEILPNRNVNCGPIFTNGLEELLVSFEKCKNLSPFIPSSTEYNNKFLIIQANDYEFADNSDSISVLKNFDSGPISRLCEKIDFLKQCTTLTFDLIRVGGSYNAETKICNKLLSKPKFVERRNLNEKDGDFNSGSRNLMEISIGNSFLRFDSFQDLSLSLESVIENYQSTSIPTVNVDLYKFQNLHPSIIRFSEIEINGTFYSILDKNLFSIQLSINNLLSKSTEKNIMMKLKLNTSKLDPEPLKLTVDKFLELPLLNYQTQWLDKHDEFKAMVIKLANPEAESNTHLFIFNSHSGGLTPPNYYDKQPFYSQTPLLPPLSSSRDRTLVKRKTELAVFESIRMINDQSLKPEVLTMINYSIGLVTKLGKELSIDNDFKHDYLSKHPIEKKSNKKLNNRASIQILNSDKSGGCDSSRDYIQLITDQLIFIQNLFDEQNPMALTKCQDLANLLM